MAKTSSESYFEKEIERLNNLLKDSEFQRIKERFLLQKLDLFNENNPLAVIEWDMNSCVVEWNKSAETIFGYTKEEAIGKRASDLVVPDSAKEEADKVWHLLYGNEGGARSTNNNVTKDGKIIICEWYNIPIINAKGIVLGASSMALDITEKVKTKADLDESNARFKMLSESTFEGIIIHKDGITIDVNSSLERLTQYDREELIGKDAIELIIAEEFKQRARESIKNKQSKPYEIKLRKKNGDIIWVEAEAKSIRYRGMDIRTVALREIEDRKKNEQKLKIALFEAQESDRLKSSFLSTISHELRTPLNAVIGFSDLIDTDMDVDEAVSLSKMIFQSGNHLLEIINDIFDLSMLEEGTMILLNEEQNLSMLLDEVKEYISQEKRKMGKLEIGLNFNSDFEKENIVINTDPKRLKQIFIHLLKNALKYTKQGSIEVGYLIIPEEIRFYVKDSGIGIASDKQKHIFELFRQVDDSHTREFGGIGIGLSIAKILCENLGGKISLESKLGEGTTFYFTIPYNKDLSDKKHKLPNPIIDLSILNGKTILIAEDDASSFELLEMYLKPQKVKILWAKNGVEAIDIFNKSRNIDLILMDIKMPGSVN